MGWNYLSIPKLQRLHRWSLGMDKQFHPMLYWACDYLSMLGFKLNHVSKKGLLQIRVRGQRNCLLEITTSANVIIIRYHYSSVIMSAMAFQITGVIGHVSWRYLSHKGDSIQLITYWRVSTISLDICGQNIDQFRFSYILKCRGSTFERMIINVMSFARVVHTHVE